MNTLTEQKPTKTKIFNDDIYLIDTSSDCSVVSSRHGKDRLSHVDNFLDVIDKSDRGRLFSWLVSFDKETLELNTKVGKATLYNGLFPSTMMFVAQFKNSEGAEDIPCLISSALMTSVPTKDNLCEQALAIAELCGCAVEIDADGFEDTSSNEDDLVSEFDFPLYSAFLINLLLLARRAAKTREAKIILKTKEENPHVSVSFELADGHTDVYGELSSMSNISEQLRLLFLRDLENRHLTVTLSPIRKDWALLGIKTPFEFTWDDGEPTA